MIEEEVYGFIEEQESRITTTLERDDLNRNQMASLIGELRVLTRLQNLLDSLDRY